MQEKEKQQLTPPPVQQKQPLPFCDIHFWWLSGPGQKDHEPQQRGFIIGPVRL